MAARRVPPDSGLEVHPERTRDYEDWGDGRGHLYGQVTDWDPTRRYGVRTRLHAATITDTLTSLEPVDGGFVLRSSRVIVGPIDDEQEQGISFHGDVARFEAAIRKVVEVD